MTQQYKSQQLLQAHIDFILADRDNRALAAIIEQEVDAFYQWGTLIKVQDIISSDWLTPLLTTLLRQLPCTPAMGQTLAELLRTAVKSNLNQSINVAALVNKTDFDDAVAQIAKLHELRQDVIHLLLNTPIYSELISDLMYHGIMEYVMNENIVAKKLPGVSAFMKAGAKSLNRAMPNLESAAEGTIKRYIAENLKGSVDLSERILNNALSEKNIKSIADHLWATLSPQDFTRLEVYFSEADTEAGIAVGLRLWESVRASSYIESLVAELVTALLLRQGDSTLVALLEQWGYQAPVVKALLQGLLSNHSVNPAIRYFLEQRLRVHLEAFYSSPAVADILSH